MYIDTFLIFSSILTGGLAIPELKKLFPSNLYGRELYFLQLVGRIGWTVDFLDTPSCFRYFKCLYNNTYNIIRNNNVYKLNCMAKYESASPHLKIEFQNVLQEPLETQMVFCDCEYRINRRINPLSDRFLEAPIVEFKSNTGDVNYDRNRWFYFELKKKENQLEGAILYYLLKDDCMIVEL